MISVTIPKERQGENIDLGMAPEPENMLPEHGHTTSRHGENVRAEVAVAVQHYESAVNTGNASKIKIAVTNMFQVKIGIRNMVMPGARR